MRSPRDALILPVAVVLTVGWVSSLAVALYSGKPEVFLITTGPFGAMCGWLFVRDTFRRADNGEKS